MLDGLHDTVGLTWAWSIVALDVIVRMLLVPLTVKQIHSMQNLQAHAPEMKEIQQKYKHDKQKMNEEMMEFYRENNINPAASCLPILAQFPIFIALFFVLKRLRGGDPRRATRTRPRVARPRPEHHRADEAPTGRAICCSSSTSEPARLDVLHVDDDADRRSAIMLLVLPFAFIPSSLNFPAGLCSTG